MYESVCVNVCVCVCVWIFEKKCVCSCAHVRACMCVCVCTFALWCKFVSVKYTSVHHTSPISLVCALLLLVILFYRFLCQSKTCPLPEIIKSLVLPAAVFNTDRALSANFLAAIKDTLHLVYSLLHWLHARKFSLVACVFVYVCVCECVCENVCVCVSLCVCVCAFCFNYFFIALMMNIRSDLCCGGPFWLETMCKII